MRIEHDSQPHFHSAIPPHPDIPRLGGCAFSATKLQQKTSTHQPEHHGKHYPCVVNHVPYRSGDLPCVPFQKKVKSVRQRPSICHSAGEIQRGSIGQQGRMLPLPVQCAEAPLRINTTSLPPPRSIREPYGPGMGETSL